MAKKDLFTNEDQNGVLGKRAKELGKKALEKTPQGQIAKQVLDKGNDIKDAYHKFKNKASPDEDKKDKKDGLDSEKDPAAKKDDSSKESENKLGDKPEKEEGLLGPKKKKDGLLHNAKKVYKIGKTVHTVGKFTMLYMMFKQMLLYLFMALKNLLGFLASILAKLVAFVQGIVQAISGFIQGVVNVGAQVANFIASALVFASGIGLVVGAISVANGNNSTTDAIKSDGDVISCAVSDSKTSDAASLTSAVGDVSQMQKDNAEKIYSVMHEIGYDDNFIAGVLGNFQIESGIDPTSIETIYTEPYQIGPRKKHAIEVGYDVMRIDASYGSKYPAIKTVGRGLGQWTNERGDLLIMYAKKLQKDWFDAGVQLAFMIGADTRKDYMKSRIHQKMSVEEATSDFLVQWEGNPGDKVGQRTAQAKFWRAQIKDFQVQKEYADSIVNSMDMDMADLNHSLALSASRSEKADACVTEDDEAMDEQLDNTGVWPEDVQGWAWSPATLPDSLKKFTHDPEKYGLKYHGQTGWIEHSGQCVDFSNSYYSVLYPKQAGITIGNGTATAERWAERFGGKTSNIPHAGSVFSCDNGYSDGAGHTGVVDHVFANGDILIIEQNTSLSGHNAGMPDTWNWRKITKEEYQGKKKAETNTWNWRFFKPDRVDSKWGKAKKTKKSKASSTAEKYNVKNANAVVQEAFKHLGKPYVWGAKGPDTFDCSGLTRYAYLKATGKDIGMNTTAQERSGKEIPLGEAKQGDLYFWGVHGASYHVALALGDGKYIEAPEPGLTIRVKDVNWNRPSFALRPSV